MTSVSARSAVLQVQDARLGMGRAARRGRVEGEVADHGHACVPSARVYQGWPGWACSRAEASQPLEHGVQVHRAVHAWNRLAMGVGLLEADLGFEPVRVDQQQDKVGPACTQVLAAAACCAGEKQPMTPSLGIDSVV